MSQARDNRVASPDVPGQLGIAEIQDACSNQRHIFMTHDAIRDMTAWSNHDPDALSAIQELFHEEAPGSPTGADD